MRLAYVVAYMQTRCAVVRGASEGEHAGIGRVLKRTRRMCDWEAGEAGWDDWGRAGDGVGERRRTCVRGLAGMRALGRGDVSRTLIKAGRGLVSSLQPAYAPPLQA